MSSDLQLALETIRRQIQVSMTQPENEYTAGFIHGLKRAAATIEGIEDERAELKIRAKTGNAGNAAALKDEEVPRS